MVIQNEVNNSLLFPVNVIDNRYDYVFLSGSVEPARIVLQDYFKSFFVGSFTGLVLVDNALRAGDNHKRFLSFEVIDNIVQRKSTVVELQSSDNIRTASNHILSKLTGLLDYSLIDKSQLNYN